MLLHLHKPERRDTHATVPPPATLPPACEPHLDPDLDELRSRSTMLLAARSMSFRETELLSLMAGCALRGRLDIDVLLEAHVLFAFVRRLALVC